MSVKQEFASVQKYESISQHLLGDKNEHTDYEILEDDSISDQYNYSDSMHESIIKLSGYSGKILRSIKLEIEALIIQKVKALEEDIEKHNEKSSSDRKKSVQYLKKFSIDKLGNQVTVGQTGIAEGWNVPIYKSEFQNLIGLPFTEDHALSSNLRFKKPKQECFNCLSSDHRVTECPVKINNDRIAMHRSEFNSQSVQSHDQMNLLSTRYTSGPDASSNRGFTPGKISDSLKEALGCKPDQLPPFIYMMRQYGYPTAWLKEAQVDTANKLSVHNGDGLDNINSEEMVLNEFDLNNVEYDQNKIHSFIGFNEEPPRGVFDEYEKYGVRKYSYSLSRETFLTTLKLEKKKVIKRRSIYQNDSQLEENEDESDTEIMDETKNSSEEIIDETESSKESLNSKDNDKKVKLELGTSFNEIPGTPIVENVKGMTMVPDIDKFSVDICEHKSYEMTNGTPTGSYQRIVNLTREFKSTADGQN